MLSHEFQPFLAIWSNRISLYADNALTAEHDVFTQPSWVIPFQSTHKHTICLPYWICQMSFRQGSRFERTKQSWDSETLDHFHKGLLCWVSLLLPAHLQGIFCFCVPACHVGINVLWMCHVSHTDTRYTTRGQRCQTGKILWGVTLLLCQTLKPLGIALTQVIWRRFVLVFPPVLDDPVAEFIPEEHIPVILDN